MPQQKEVHIPGMPVPVYERDALLHWSLPPVEEVQLRELRAENSLYGHLPRLAVKLTPKLWHSPDTAAVLGALNPESREAFHTITRSTFRAQEPGNDSNELTAPLAAKGALPALHAIALTSRANLPPELVDILWPLTRIAVRTGQCVVDPGEGGRKVEMTGKGDRPAPDTWHVHNESTRTPDFKHEIHIPEDSYVVASSLPTVMADDHRLITTPAERAKAEAAGFTVEGKKVLHAFKQPHTLEPYEIAIFTDDTWHTSQKNKTGSPVVRCFMRVFNRVPWQSLLSALKENPGIERPIRRFLRREAPDTLRISRELLP